MSPFLELFVKMSKQSYLKKIDLLKKNKLFFVKVVQESFVGFNLVKASGLQFSFQPQVTILLNPHYQFVQGCIFLGK